MQTRGKGKIVGVYLCVHNKKNIIGMFYFYIYGDMNSSVMQWHLPQMTTNGTSQNSKDGQLMEICNSSRA